MKGLSVNWSSIKLRFFRKKEIKNQENRRAPLIDRLHLHPCSVLRIHLYQHRRTRSYLAQFIMCDEPCFEYHNYLEGPYGYYRCKHDLLLWLILLKAFQSSASRA